MARTQFGCGFESRCIGPDIDPVLNPRQLNVVDLQPCFRECIPGVPKAPGTLLSTVWARSAMRAGSVANLREAVAICRAVKRDNLGLLIDTLHFNRSRFGRAELDSVPKEWFHFAHVCDASREIPTTNAGLIHTGREERLYPGEGAIDIAAIVNRLPSVPYSREIPNLARVAELGYAEHAWRCLEAARKYFAAHPRV